MSMDTYKGKSADELKSMEGELRKELFNLRFQQATGELANTSRFKEVKKEIARIHTYRAQSKQAA